MAATLTITEKNESTLANHHKTNAINSINSINSINHFPMLAELTLIATTAYTIYTCYSAGKALSALRWYHLFTLFAIYAYASTFGDIGLGIVHDTYADMIIIITLYQDGAWPADHVIATAITVVFLGVAITTFSSASLFLIYGYYRFVRIAEKVVTFV